MKNLQEKLRSLGVSVGVDGLEPKKKSEQSEIETIPGARRISTPAGNILSIESQFENNYRHGYFDILLTAPLENIATWCGEPQIVGLNQESFLFLDTESTGLSGGTGTYAFIIGAGRFDTDGFRIVQFFMNDPIEEPSQLLAFEEFMAPCKALVTFNGKSFDLPLLVNRFIAHGWKSPFSDMAHIDLLHLSRRIWKDRIKSRTLSNLEVQILGALRSEDDIPGWMVPGIYFDYLRDGDPEPLKRVFYHNKMDVLSLASLLNYLADMLADPIRKGDRYGSDLVALGKLFKDLGDDKSALLLYSQGLQHEDKHAKRLPQSLIISALLGSAQINKKEMNYQAAIELWEKAAAYGNIQAHIELAKFYEHKAREPQKAIEWTNTAIGILENSTSQKDSITPLISENRNNQLSELYHRLNRLKRKFG